MNQLTRQEVEGVIERNADKSYLYGEAIAPNLYSLNEIFIGDILEKMEVLVLAQDGVPYATTPNTRTLLVLWEPLGFSKSLQQIVEDSGWERVRLYSPLLDATFGGTSVTEATSISIQDVEVLRSPEANALFSFLLEIGV